MLPFVNEHREWPSEGFFWRCSHGIRNRRPIEAEGSSCSAHGRGRLSYSFGALYRYRSEPAQQNVEFSVDYSADVGPFGLEC